MFPVRWTSAIRMFILMLISLGLKLTSEQVVAVMMFVETVFGVAVHNSVTPNATADARVATAIANLQVEKDI